MSFLLVWIVFLNVGYERIKIRKRERELKVWEGDVEVQYFE